MKLSEIREKSTAELRVLEDELRLEQFHMRMKHATQQLDQTHRLKEMRKTIARIRTVFIERHMVESSEA